MNSKAFPIQKKSKILVNRPDVFYVQNKASRKMYETAIRAPDKNFFQLMYESNVYFWIVVKKDLSKDSTLYKKVKAAFQCARNIELFKELPICSTLQKCQFWTSQFPCQIIMDEDIFEIFDQLNKIENASGFHIVSQDNYDIASIARQNRKIKNVYDDYDDILEVLQKNVEKIAIINVEKKNRKNGAKQKGKMHVKNVVFPNFIKLTKKEKSEHNAYRLNLIGLRRLSQDDKFASKDKFIKHSKETFTQDTDLIEQYANASFDTAKQVLQFYSLDSFFYKCLNNSMRLAKNTQQFFSIAEPFNKVFEAIKSTYQPKAITVYRGADLTNSQCIYLKENIGKYIQIHGFISTSKKQQTARNFSKVRKSNKIFQIQIKEVPKTSKFKEYDYGFVDLQQKKYSAFDEDQILINALNIFKIKGMVQRDGYEVFILEYGTIFEVLEAQDPQKLSDNDRYAFYTFKQLMQMDEEVQDIGDVYLKTLQPEKSIQIYKLKISKMNQSLDPSQSGEIQRTKVKLAQAYLANGQPDAALKQFKNIISANRNLKAALNGSKQPPLILKKQQSTIYLSQQSFTESDYFRVSTKMSSIQNTTDKFQDAQSSIKLSKTRLNQNLKKQFNINLFQTKIQLQNERYQSRVSQQLYQQAFDILNQIEKQINQVLKREQTSNIRLEPHHKKKLLLTLTLVYERQSEIIEKLETKKTKILDIFESFQSVESNLKSVIEQKSYDQGVLNLRRSVILARTQKLDKKDVQKKLYRSLRTIKNTTNEKDQILPKTYDILARFIRKINKPDRTDIKKFFKRKLKVETIIYGNLNPIPLETKTQLAICERDDKNTYEALCLFDQAYNTDLFRSKQKYSHHAKILFFMAQAYSDKGDNGLAMKSYQQGYDILKKCLSKIDFQRSVLRFQINLKIGRLYLQFGLNTKQNLVLAQNNLMLYHRFIVAYYKHNHSDIALSHSCLGVLNLEKKQRSKSRDQFLLSIKIYQEVKGLQSIQVAKNQANLALAYATLNDKKSALKSMNSSEQIFQNIYGNLRKMNPFEYEFKDVQATMFFYLKEYRKAIASCLASIEKQKQFILAKKNINKSFYNRQIKISELQGKSKQNLTTNRSEITAYHKSNISQIANIRERKTENELKCMFRICECLNKLKQFDEVEQKLLNLKVCIYERMAQESKSHLLRDSLYSNKQLFIKKLDIMLKEISQYRQSLQKNKIQQKKQDSSSLNSQNQTKKTK